MQFINKKPRAVAVVRGDELYSDIRGTVRFYQMPGGVLIEADFIGLPGNNSGFYGFHIHTGRNCGGEGFPESGGHISGFSKKHPMHSGDLPPLLSCNGRAYMAVMTDRISIRDILGRTILVHSGADDFCSQPAGNAGRKIACGVIGPVTFIKK